MAGLLDVIRAAAVPAAVARGAYLTGQQQGEERKAKNLREQISQSLEDEWKRSQTAENTARAKALGMPKPDAGEIRSSAEGLVRVGADNVARPITDANGNRIRASAEDGTPARGTPGYLKMIRDETQVRRSVDDAATDARTGAEEEQLGLAIINQRAPDPAVAQRFNTAYRNLRAQFPGERPGRLAYRAAQAAGWFTSSGSMMRQQAPEPPKRTLADLMGEMGGGGAAPSPAPARPAPPPAAADTRRAAPMAPAGPPPVSPRTPVTPPRPTGGAGVVSLTPAPRKPLAERIAELKNQGYSREQAKALLEKEGYDLRTTTTGSR